MDTLIINFIFGQINNTVLLKNGSPISVSDLSDTDLQRFFLAADDLCTHLNNAIVKRLISLKNVEE